MNDLSKILKRLMSKAQMSEQELARRISLNQSVIHRLISGENQNPTLASLKAISNYFLISVSQLIGEQPIPELSEGRYNTDHLDWKKIPLLSWSQAGKWKRHLQEYQTSSNEYETIRTDADISPIAFALIINGSSMEPRFEKGTIIVVDPNITPEDKDFVVIQEHNASIAAFKEIISDGGKSYTRSLNPMLRETAIKLKKEDKIIATMIQAINYRS